MEAGTRTPLFGAELTVVLFDEGALLVNPFHFKDALAADFKAPAAAEAALAIDPVDVPR
jgi:hypothetical protein